MRLGRYCYEYLTSLFNRHMLAVMPEAVKNMRQDVYAYNRLCSAKHLSLSTLRLALIYQLSIII